MTRWICLGCVFLMVPAARAQLALPEGALARVGSIQLRHQSAILQLAFLPDGALGALDARGCFRVWDPVTGLERRNFTQQSNVEPESPDVIRRMEIMMMIGGGKFGRRRIINERGFAGGMFANKAFSPDGRYLAVPALEKVTVWDMTSGKARHQLTYHVPDKGEKREMRDVSLTPVAWSLDGRLLAASTPLLGGSVVVWDAGSGKELHTLKVPQEHLVGRLHFFPGGAHLAGLSDDQVIVWDLKLGKRVRTYQSLREGMACVTLAPDGKRLATVSDEGRISLWEDGSEEEASFITGTKGDMMLAFGPDARTLAVAGVEASLRLYDAVNAKETLKLEGHKSPVGAMTFTPDGKTLATGDGDGRIRLWDTSKGKELLPLDHDAPVTFALIQGKTLVLGAPDGSTRQADLLTGKVQKRFKAPDGEPGTLDFSPDGKILVLRGNEEKEAPLKLWDVQQGKELRSLKGTAGVGSLVFSPDSKRIALLAGEDNTIQLWDVKSGELLLPMGRAGELIGFTVDGRSLVTFAGGQVSIWEIATGKLRQRFQGPAGDPRASALSPDGRTLATAHGEVIRFWSLSAGRVQRALVGHVAEVMVLAWSRDGSRLASGSGDGSVRIWDVARGEPMQYYMGHRDAVRCLGFSADGKYLVSGSNDGTALVWDLDAPGVEPPKSLPGAAKLELLWEQLASDDSEVAFQAHTSLAAHPEAVAFLKRVVKPASPVAPEQVKRLIADLDDRRYPVREKAMAELTKLGGQAEKELRAALSTKPGKEVSQRLQQLLETLSRPAAAGEDLRLVRAVEVLEKLHTPTARQLLQELTRGAPGARLTEEAKAALDRLTSSVP